MSHTFISSRRRAALPPSRPHSPRTRTLFLLLLFNSESRSAMSHTNNIVKRAIFGYIESPAFAPAPFPSVDTEDWDALINNEKSRHAMAGMIQLIRELLLSAELWKKILGKIDVLGGLHAIVGRLWHSPGVKAYAVVDWVLSILGPLATVALAAYRAKPGPHGQASEWENA
ncbi:hypothetical protein DFH08DRAFT_1037314 [Mycena albidolilacea]|uniref:Uncharacterized protein n=1 Tax=Mycena albidolilacea TaxID=1033008 RepID=A0AAD7AHF8_9AGAR|nr:hypothetical protein DFH08DRAFT_1037314 [Mycena albidolilacea]